MRLWGLGAGLIAILLAAALLRLAMVRANPESASARTAWPNYPAVLNATAMREIGVAAASGAQPPTAALNQIYRLADLQPLSAQPFLVEGALAEKQGRPDRAEHLLLEARRRNPRSTAADYLLADLYLRSDRIADGIRVMADLSRLMPNSAIPLAPALAQFARSPGAPARLRQIFHENPELEQPVLGALAADPANADLILSVATHTGPQSGGEPPSWEEMLLDSMVAHGAYAKAHVVWARIVGPGTAAGQGLFNPAFHQSNAPPPFNWSFDSTGAGVAEPDNGSLRVLFYGRDNATLARQLLLLEPGRYHLTVPVSVASGSEGALRWALVCLPANRAVATLPIPAAAGSQTLAVDFAIPPQGCDAQRLELDGTIEDSPETADLRFGPLGLQRTGS